MFQYLKDLIIKAHKDGIPIPLINDPIKNGPSVSLTLLVISAIVVFIGLVGNYTKFIEVDIQQSIYWFGICSALYFGRSFSGNSDKKVVSLDNNSKEIKSE